MNEDVRRWLTILLGSAVVGVVAWFMVSQGERRPHVDPGAADAAPLKTDAAVEPTVIVTRPELDAGLSLVFLADAAVLPSSAPRSVKLGVVLVQYLGAEGASSSARAKKDALAYAEKLAVDAKTDWKGAVKNGDSGSSEDIGRIPRGVLDPATEVAVFSLAAGEVSGVIDTPRGYWIVKRAE